ncbi:MAG: hypothetical protein M5U28_51190 [Sandaracinaceae bacterium]|nr:hypothetical protein [Sandaracinaceae bacterium]
MEWLQHDEVALEQLPEWARAPGEVLDGRPYAVVAHAEGLVLTRARRASAVRWEDVLVPIRLDEPRRLLVAAARRPPRPPWFELGGHDVARIERAVRARLDAIDHRGYRERRRGRDVVGPDEVLTRVLERRALPGAVEIPAATASVARSALTGAAVGGATLGLYGLVFGPAGMILGGATGALGGATLMGGIEALRKRATGRVLVLTPDAFVGGLDGQSVRAVPWFRVGRFVEGVDDLGGPALEVFAPDSRLIARVAARFFGQPLDVIVAVAEAYRRRATDESV